VFAAGREREFAAKVSGERSDAALRIEAAKGKLAEAHGGVPILGWVQLKMDTRLLRPDNPLSPAEAAADPKGARLFKRFAYLMPRITPLSALLEEITDNTYTRHAASVAGICRVLGRAAAASRGTTSLV
jgi:hypothetical protein